MNSASNGFSAAPHRDISHDSCLSWVILTSSLASGYVSLPNSKFPIGKFQDVTKKGYRWSYEHSILIYSLPNREKSAFIVSHKHSPGKINWARAYLLLGYWISSPKLKIATCLGKVVSESFQPSHHWWWRRTKEESFGPEELSPKQRYRLGCITSVAKAEWPTIATMVT